MPGIVGIISQKPANECESLVKSMVGSMEHEQFYCSGTYSAPEMGVYGGWVALDNSLAASQTFLNEKKDVALIFSGECFTDPKTVIGLRQRGHQFAQSSGDWLVHMYEEEGDRFFEKINGLFSGLLIDKRQRKAYLFNDRYGAERIYWHEANDAFYFASEAKALLRILPELREFDPEGVAQFVAFGCTVNWRSLLRGVSLLPGGSLWCFDNGKCLRRSYFSSATWESQPLLSEESFDSEFRETFRQALPIYFEPESEIGISLTGGLDTRMIMACRPEVEASRLSYTFSGQKNETFDDRVAAKVAKVCGLEHHLLRLGNDFLPDFASHLDRGVYLTDGCCGVTGAHEVYFNERAGNLARIRLTGLFGSEILRGMSTFKPVGISSSLLGPELEQAVNSSVTELGRDRAHPITSAAFRNVPWNLFGNVAASRSQVVCRSPYLDNRIVALAFRAPESLRTSPATALNIIRDGDPRLAAIPTDRGVGGTAGKLPRTLNRLSLEVLFKLDYYHNEGMPDWFCRFDPMFNGINSVVRVFGQHKYLHYRKWFRRELASYLTDVLDRPSVRQNQFWNAAFIADMASAHIHGRRNYIREIHAVLTLEAVERLFFHELSRETRSFNRSRASSESSLAVARP